MSNPHPPTIGQAWDDHFKDQTHIYQFSEGLPFLKKFSHSPFIQLTLHYAQLSPKAAILEAGCGSGKFSFCFALMGHRVTALDYSLGILANVEKAQRALEQTTGPLPLQTLQGDLENLMLEVNQFDLVINEGVVEHWLNQTSRRQVLSQMVRVTKPNGTIAVIVPNGNHPWVDYWVTKNPAFLAAPPMIHYTPTLLHSDLAAVGLTAIQTDGIYAWRSIDDWPRTQRVYRWLGGLLQHLIPLPHTVRKRWGLHLIGLGRKP